MIMQQLSASVQHPSFFLGGGGGGGGGGIMIKIVQ